MQSSEPVQLRAGTPWVMLAETLLESIRVDVARRLLDKIDGADVDELVAWATAISPAQYQPVGIGRKDAESLIARRPYRSIEDVVTRGGLDHGRLGDLVYAAAAAGATHPEEVRVEDVYELSLLGVAAIASLYFVRPEVADDIEVSVERARLDILGREVITEWPVIVRQRSQPDPWSELELDSRSRIWYLGISERLYNDVQSPDTDLSLCPRLGAEFSDVPVLQLATDAADDTEPLPNSSSTYQYFSFPEIEGSLFLIKFHRTSNDEWRAFTAADGDVRFFGPSYPTEVVVHIGGESSVWTQSGELRGSVTSSALEEALQKALESRQERAANAHDVLLVVTSMTPGDMTLALRTDLYLCSRSFTDGSSERTLTFSSDVLEHRISLQVPDLGQPVRADLAVVGQLATTVVAADFGTLTPATGADAIGVHLQPGVEFVQRLEVEEPLEVSTVSLRLANPLPGTRVDIEIDVGEERLHGSITLPRAGRVPEWYAIELSKSFVLEEATSYHLRTSLFSGAVTWICGREQGRFYVFRDDGLAPPTEVRDVADGSPLTGRVRLHTRLSEGELQLAAYSVAGGDRLQCHDVTIHPDGSFSGRIDALPVVRRHTGEQLELRLQAKAEGNVLVRDIQIGHRMSIESR